MNISQPISSTSKNNKTNDDVRKNHIKIINLIPFNFIYRMQLKTFFQ
jgi:hypothetical protein